MTTTPEYTVSGIYNPYKLPQYFNIHRESPIKIEPATVGNPNWNMIKDQTKNNIGQLAFTDKVKVGTDLLGTVANAYLGYKAMQQAKEQMAFNKEQYYTNLLNQRKMINSQLEDRQAKRTQENIANSKPVGTSVSEYMAKYGV